jgi:hypothetical protein
MIDRIKELREIMISENFDPAIIELILAETESFESEKPDATLESLERTRRKVGKKAEIISKRTGNLLINWKDLTMKVIPAGVAAAGTTFLTGPFFGLFACLALLRVVGDATEVTLSDDHAKVVNRIWETDLKDRKAVDVQTLRNMTDLDLTISLDEILEDLAALKTIDFVDDDTFLKIELLVIHPGS